MGLFICDVCGGEFETEGPDDQAEAEFKKKFGRDVDVETAEVCDSCYKKMFGTHSAD